MKNIHVLPTYKPTRLRYFDSKLEIMFLIPKKSDIVFQNIYITSDEKIKEGDYVIWNGKVYKDSKRSFTGVDYSQCKKIILTTDQDLIADGVQSIPDDFLEWFVKNPSCEEVEVEIETTSIQLPQQQLSENSYDLAFRWINKKVYKIIIPKEEPKQEGYICPHTKLQCDDECCVSAENCHIISSMGILSEPKQETVQQFIEQHGITEQQLIDGYKQGLELIFEAASKITKQETLEEAGKDYIENTMKFSFKFLETKTQANRMLKCVEFGAKWQAERMYSEEEVLNILQKVEVSKTSILQQGINGWFKQFKKK
jgi:hypothetical protein